MHKSVYYLSFAYRQKGKIKTYSIFVIGYLSTKQKALTKIDEYCKLPGFKDYPKSCFEIKKYHVKVDNNFDPENFNVYVISSNYDKNDNIEIIRFFAPYYDYARCEKKYNKLKSRKKSVKRAEEFYLSKYCVDKKFEWSEGFTTYD